MTPEEYLALLQSKTQRTQSDPESVLQWYQSYNDQLRAQQSQIEQQRLEKERIAAERFAAQESAMLKAQQEQAVRKARTDDASDQYNPRVFFNSEGFKNASYKKKRELAEEWVNTVGTKYAEPAALEDFRKNLDERLGIAEPKSTITEDITGTAAGLVSGFVGIGEAVTNLADIDNPASKFLKEQRKKLKNLQSAEQVERNKQLDEQGQKYEAEGNVLGQVMTGAERILTTGPGAAEMIGSTAAALIPGAAVGKLAQGAALAKGASAAAAAARATKAATTAMSVTGAAIGGGDVKGGIYEAVQNASDTELMGDPSYALMRKNGLTEKQAKDQFGKEQSEYMNSPLAIIAGAAAGYAAARLGSVERAAAGAGKAESQKAIAEAAKQLLTKNTKFAVSPALINRSGEFLRGAGREVLTEAPQAATEVLAANLGASPAIPATRGLAESVGAAVAGGTALGGPAGLVQSRVDRLTQAKQTAPIEKPPEQQPEVPQAGEVEAARRVVEEYQATQNPELADEYESALTILENAGVIVGEAQATEATVTPEVKEAFNVLDSYAMGESPTDAEWNSALQTISKAGLDPDAYLEDRTVRRLPAAAANATTNVAISTSGGVPVGGTITAPVGDRAGQRSGQQDAGAERNIAGAAPVGIPRIGPLNDEQVQSTSVDGQTAENLGVEGQVEPIDVESLVGQVVDYDGNVGILAKTQSGYYVNGQVVESGMSGQPAQTLGIKQLSPERAEAFIAGESLGRIAPELQQVPRETDLDVERDVLLLEFEELIGVDETNKIIDIALSQLGGGANFDQQLNAVKGALYGYLEQATAPTSGVQQTGGTATQSRARESAGSAGAGQSTSPTQAVGGQNAVQVQSPSESLLRSQRPEIGLQENGEGNQVNEVAAGTGQEEKVLTEEDIYLADLEQQLAEIDKQYEEVRSSKTLNLFSMLKGSLSRSERNDVSPDRIYRLLQAKKGGADLSDMVSDGALNDFLPYDMRPDSSRFDATDSTEYIKEKLRARDFVPYDVEIELSRLGDARQQIESEINEIKSIRQANEELQQLADEEAISRSESSIADATSVPAGILARPNEEEVIAQQERVEQAEQLDQREQIRKEAEAAPLALTVQEGRVDNTGTLFSETSEPIQNPTTPNAIKQAVNALFGGDVWAKISRGTEIVTEAEAKNKLGKLKGKYALASLLAYHGSPHRFDKFSTEKIGTGEGAQAYGWGLYFASKKEIAESYRKTLSAKIGVNPSVVLDGNRFENPANQGWHDEYGDFADRPVQMAAGWMHGKEMPTQEDIDEADESGDDYVTWGSNSSADLDEVKAAWDIYDRMEFGEDGQLYEINIPNDSDMLLWDKPLSEQPVKVRNAIKGYKSRVYTIKELPFDVPAGKWVVSKDYGKDQRLFKTEDDAKEFVESQKDTGQQAYKDITTLMGSAKEASRYLEGIGIKGIKFLDGSSRGAGEGAYNYVVFNDADVEISQTFYSKLEGTAQAFYNPEDRKIYMISDRIKAGTETAVWLHEVFHKQGSNLLDQAQMKRLQSTVEAWKSKPQGSTERQIYDAANERATKSGNYDDEFLAYAIEEAVKIGVTPDSTKPITTAEGWLGKVQAWFSKALSKLTGKAKAVDFTPQDLVAMAYGAAGLELEGIEGAGPNAFGGNDIVLSLSQPEARQNIEGAIREREPKVLRPRATRIGESIGTQLTDYKIKGRNLIYEAGQKYGGMLEKAGERLQNAMTTARNQGNGLVEIMTRDIVAPLEENIKAIAKANGINPNNGRIYGGELAAAKHALDLSNKKQDRLLNDLLTAEINEEISKDLADVAKAEKANIAEVVERIRGMEDRFKKAWDEGRDFALSKTTVTRQVNELAQIVDRMVTTITPLQKDGVDRTLTAGKIKKVNDAMLRLAADSVRSGDPYLMLEVARKYTEAVSSMADLPKAKEVHKKAKEELAKWKKAQSTPLRLDKEKQDIATETPLPGGMTMAEAQAIIDMREAQPGVGEIADLLVKAFRDINTEAVNNRIITAEKKSELEALFPFYVSMSGDKNADADDDFMFSRGRNFIDKAEGRTGFMGQQNAFDNVIAKVQQLGNKVAAQSQARAAYDYMMLESQVVPETDRLFEKVKMPGQNVMKVYSMGSTQYFQGKPQVMKDAMGDLVDADNFLIKAGQAATRGYGSWMTKYVGFFAPLSSFKEILTRTVNLVQLRNYKKADGTKYTMGDVYKIRGSTLKNALSPPNFWDAAKYAATGETSPDLERLMRDGGKMSFSDMLTTEGEVSNAFKKKYPGAWKTVGFVPKVFHIWNQMFEVSVLLASYKGLMANGMSSKDAAAFVVSQMNFGAKGKATNFLRTFFPFVNPTMQDALQVKRSLYHNGKVNYQGVVELTVLTALLGVLYEMARDSEEDEFGKPKVDAMPMSMVANGFSIGNLYIPMPFGIPQLANVMAIAMSRLENGVYTKGEAAAEISTAWVKAFSPQGVSEIEAKKDMLGFLMSTVAPTLAKPAYHASKGINAFGTKVTAAERADVYKSEQGMRMTPEAYKKFAKAVNDKLGIDANPEQYKILAEGYLLGILRGVLDTVTDPIADRESKGGDTSGMRTPINYALGINRLYKEFPESQIIETRFGDAYSEYQKLAKQFNAKVKKVRATEKKYQKLNRFYEAGATDAQIEFIDAVLEYESEMRKENAEMKKIYENGILSDDPTMQELGRDTLKDMYAQKLERKREIARMHLQLKDNQ